MRHENTLLPAERLPGVRYPDEDRLRRYAEQGVLVPQTLPEALRASCEANAERLALVGPEGHVTYREFDERSARLGAALLELGLRPLDRAIFQCGNSNELLVAFYACLKAGIIPICSLQAFRKLEIDYLGNLAQARLHLVQGDDAKFDDVAFAETMQAEVPSLQYIVQARGARRGKALSLAELIEAMPAEQARRRLAQVEHHPFQAAVFQLSGGTTGVPKIIPRFHAEYLGHSAGWMRRYRIDADSRLIWSLPLLHNAGQLYALIPPVLAGVSVVLMSRVDIPRMLDLIGLHRVTHALSIGPIAPQLLAYPDIARHDLSSLRLFSTMSRADTLEAHLGLPCSNLFGITEGLLLGSPADEPAEARHRTQGRSGCEDDEIRLLEPGTENAVREGQMGELCFRGPSSLTGYFANPEANAQSFTSDGFYRTGDVVTARRVNGVLYYAFEGRLRDNINRGGEKIGCEEVESHVSHHPAVADAKLVPMPDPFYGEKGCIFIIARPGMQAPDVDALGRFLVDRGLARFKCPERVEVVDEFPTTRVGKVDKPAMKRLIVDILEKETGK